MGDIITVAGGGAGDGAPATTARLNGPAAVVADEEGALYIADTGNHRIRLVDVEGEVETIAGPLEGKKLTQAPAHNAFWFARATFWQNTGSKPAIL